MEAKFRAGQYVICKYNGDNGDLIVGKVVSVRRCGEVVLTNLLTRKPSVKSASVLRERNVVVPKKVADTVVLYSQGKHRREVRAFAVNLQHPPAPVLPKKKRDAEWYRKKAREEYALEGEIEIDDGCLVSMHEEDCDDGAWVQAWVWVRDK